MRWWCGLSKVVVVFVCHSFIGNTFFYLLAKNLSSLFVYFWVLKHILVFVVLEKAFLSLFNNHISHILHGLLLCSCIDLMRET